MYKKQKLSDYNDFQERKHMLQVVESLKYSPKTYTEKEATKILNLYGQEHLTKLIDIAERNKPISVVELAEVLYKWGYIKVFNNLCYAYRPYTYNYIIPILKDGRVIGFDEELVFHSKVEDKLQQYCDQKLKKIDEEE